MPAMKSDFGADRIWWVDLSLPPKLRALRRRIATRLALGVAAWALPANGGSDIEPLTKAGVSGEQDGSGHFEIHHTAEDMLDKVDPAQSRLNVPAQAAVCSETTGAPELLGRK